MGHCEAVRRKQDVVRWAQSKKQLNQHKFFLLAGGGATGCVVFVSSRNKNKNDKKKEMKILVNEEKFCTQFSLLHIELLDIQ